MEATKVITEDIALHLGEYVVLKSEDFNKNTSQKILYSPISRQHLNFEIRILLDRDYQNN